jgi:hypothetical protein
MRRGPAHETVKGAISEIAGISSSSSSRSDLPYTFLGSKPKSFIRVSLGKTCCSKRIEGRSNSGNSFQSSIVAFSWRSFNQFLGRLPPPFSKSLSDTQGDIYNFLVFENFSPSTVQQAVKDSQDESASDTIPTRSKFKPP